jgi:hypothetical protein
MHALRTTLIGTLGKDLWTVHPAPARSSTSSSTSSIDHGIAGVSARGA